VIAGSTIAVHSAPPAGQAGEVSDAGTVIVGAGAAGLAVAACLRRAGRPFTVLERGDAVGLAWRTRYRRLHLHTAKQHSGLPFLPFPRQYPRYPSRDQVIEYLEAYRRHFDIQPRLGQAVRSVSRRADGQWTVATTAGEERASSVAICTGQAAVPFRPTWPGLELFGGEILHSSDYSSGERFAGRRVLVVGLGNSGGEIAIDLVEHGAEVEIAARSPVNVVPRDFLGMPIQRSTIVLSALPLAVRDRIARMVSRLTFGDLTEVGLPRSTEGPISGIVSRHRIPLIDVGTVALLREGKIRVRGDVAGLQPGVVQFSDGTSGAYDVVVLATGYRSGAVPLLAGQPGALNEHGYPPGPVHPELPGLFFIGFGSPPTGLLREIARDARKVARAIDEGQRQRIQ
jgi:indole-3-pyruvate monooxygenase